jgi:hypothetical protein
VEFNSGNIFTVFVERPNNYSVYYSRLKDYIYKRNADETKKISLIETLQLIESKKNPRVSLRLEFKRVLQNNDTILTKNKMNDYVYEVNLINEGLEPSFFTTGLITINISEGDVKIKKTPWNVNEDTNPKMYKYQFSCGMTPIVMPVYPKIGFSLGEFIIASETPFFKLDFIIKILDKKGITYQEFSLGDKFENEISTIAQGMLENKVNYSSYFNL